MSRGANGQRNLPTLRLTDCYVGRSQQHAIRQLRPECFQNELRSFGVKITEQWWKGAARVRLR
jgi:hypothetical protein